MEARHRMAFGEFETGADLDCLLESGGAPLQTGGAVGRVELGRSAQGDAEVVERDGARDLALGRAPLESPLEETDRFGELGRGCAEVRDRGRVVVERSRLPPGFRIGGEVRQRQREELSGAREIGGGTGSPEKDTEVVEESRAILLRREREVRRVYGEIARQGAARRFVASRRQLLLDVEPLAGSGRGIGAEGFAEMREEALRIFQNASDAVSSAGAWA